MNRRASFSNQTKLTGFERKEKSSLIKRENDIPSIDRSATYIVESENDKQNGVSKAKSEYTLPRIGTPKTTTNFQSKLIPPKPIKQIQSSTFSKSVKSLTNNNSSLDHSDDNNNSNNNNKNNNKSSQESDSNSKSNRQLSKTINLTALKQQKKAELRSQSNKVSQKEEPLLNSPKSLDVILRHAKKSGLLNLSDFGLEDIPKNIWMINNDKMDSSLTMDEQSDESFKWWDQIELSKLILASNKIKVIPKEIKQLYSLIALDLHNNEIEIIDEGIGDLNGLQTLNISHNKLKILPNNICKLRSLILLNASDNKLEQIPRNIGHLDDLEFLDFSNNSINAIPPSFGWLTKLRNLDASKNNIKKLIPEMFYSITLKMIDLSENQIESLPKEIGDLENLEQFFARHNKLKSLPYLEKCHKLKDWDMSFNQINEIDEKTFDNLVSLVNLNLRDNQIATIPRTIKKLQNIERLDLSNNNLSALPYELASIESLKQILLTGNPLRSIRKDIIARGTESIVKYLRNHLTESQDQSDNYSNSNNLLKPEIVKSTKVFDLGSKKLTEITPDMITFCKQCTAISLNASRNCLRDLPIEMKILNNQLHELNLSCNMFRSLPNSVLGLYNLTSLDLRNNQLEDLPLEIKTLKALRELIIADNRLFEIPQGVYELPILENLFVNNNKIKTIDPMGIIRMKHLTTLNLQNNDIDHVPPLLGKAQQLKSLQLEGNPFRIPRPQIIQKGTDAILEHLRGRLTES